MIASDPGEGRAAQGAACIQMINYKNTPGWDEKAHELTDDGGVDCAVEIGGVMIGPGVVNFVGPRSVRDSFARWGYPAGRHRASPSAPCSIWLAKKG
jgi:hypothetical protein